MEGASGNQDGELIGYQGSHFNLGTAKINGQNLTKAVADFLVSRDNAIEISPTLSTIVHRAITFEGLIAVQPAFINQSDAAIEVKLHKEQFNYFSTMSASLRGDFLADASQMVLNKSLQIFSQGKVADIARQLASEIRNGTRKERTQHANCAGANLLNGKQLTYFNYIIDNNLLKPNISKLFKDVSFYWKYLLEDIPAIADEISEIRALGS